MCKCISREFKKFSREDEALQPQISRKCRFETWQPCGGQGTSHVQKNETATSEEFNGHLQMCSIKSCCRERSSKMSKVAPEFAMEYVHMSAGDVVYTRVAFLMSAIFALRLILRRNLYDCPQEAAYKGQVRPVLEYSGSIWDPSGVGLQNELEKVQNRAARFVTGNYNYETGNKCHS